MGNTTKGYPYPEDTDAADVPSDVQLLAEAVDAAPGIASLSQAQIDALSAGEKWAGRVVWNQTTNKLQRSNGSTFADMPTTADVAVLSNDTPASTGTAAAGTGATASRSDHVHAIGASPALTGTPTAPTAAANTNTTQIATTAFVVGQAATANPPMDGTATPGTSLRYARQDHVHASDTSKVDTTDARLSDTRTPTDGSVTTAKIADSAVTSAKIADGTIVNADINASAAIALSKLATGALPTGITVASTNLVNGTIVDADINASAAIAQSKISGLTTALAAKGDVAGETWTGTHDFSGATLTGVPGGLVLVATASPSSASSVSIDSCFTSTYDNYRLMMYLDASTTVSVYARYRASGSDNTSAVNSWRRLYYDSSVVGSSSSSQTQMDIGVIRTGSPSQIVMDLSSPALAQEKVWTVLNREDGSARYIAGLSALNSAFDGMTFYPNTGTITGTIRIYGYQNS